MSRPRRGLLPTPPGLPGLPLLGHAPRFRQDPVRFLHEAHAALGPIFSIRLGPKPAVVLIGPEYNRFFFSAPEDLLSLPEVYRFMVPMFGRVLSACEPDEYRAQRAILQPPFQASRMASHVDLMVDETRTWLDTLGEAGELPLWSSFERLSLAIGATAMLGRELQQRMGQQFAMLYRDVARGMEFVLPTNLPLPRFRRRDRARRTLEALLRPLVAERRAQPGGHPDFLQVLAEATYTDGRLLPPETVVSMILILVFGAYETTAAQTGWALVDLLQHPSYARWVLEEQAEVLGDADGQMSLEALRRLERLEWAIRESERLRPVTTLISRHTRREYTIGGYRVPPGWLTIVSPAVSHQLPDVFPNPHVYDPERFAPHRADRQQSPFSLLTFGGGLHKCLGMPFADNEMKVVLSLLLQRYELELVEPDPAPDYSAGMTRPSPTCRIRYRRRVGPSARRGPVAASDEAPVVDLAAGAEQCSLAALRTPEGDKSGTESIVL
jgi:sterol 14-demethylase